MGQEGLSEHIPESQEGLAASTVIEKQHGISMEVTTDYTGIGKIQYIAGERSLPILDSEYTDKVVLNLLVPADQVEVVEEGNHRGNKWKSRMKKEEELYYSVIDGEVKTFTKSKRKEPCQPENTPMRA